VPNHHEGPSRRSGDGGTDRAAKAERRFAWWLAWLYPPAFRRDVGLGLVDAMEDRMRQRRAAGRSPYLPALLDTVKNVPAEWLEAARQLRVPRQPAARGRTMVDRFLQDVRYALRLWRRRPGFALIAILTLAIGVGANTAMFSIVNAVLLRPLPYPHAARLVTVFGRTAAYPQGLISYREFEEIGKQRETFESIALWLPQSVNLTGVDEPQRLIGTFATGSFFETLGLKPERGRFFTDEESAPGTVKPVVVLTHQTWQRRFNGDDGAIGKTMIVNGTPLTIIGVIAPPFDTDATPGEGYFIGADLFIPAAQFPVPRGLRAAGPVMLGVGRLKSGSSVQRANNDLEVIQRRLDAEAGQSSGTPSGASFVAQGGRTLGALSAQETIVGDSRPALLLLLASVGVVLLIACVNVSHLLLARAIDRQKEIALRAALGASRSAVARQMTVEAALLAVVSAGLGFVLGRWALRGLGLLQPPTVPIPTAIPLDWTVLLFTGGVAVVVATLCALAPAVKTARPDISRVLAAGTRRATGAGRRLRNVLVVAEMAMSVALVAVSALLIQSLLAVQNVPLGFDRSNVFTLQFRLPQAKYSKPEDIALFFRTAIERVRAIPGVESAALVRAVPFSGNGGNIGYAVEGSTADPKQLPQALVHFVTPDYFKTMRIPLLEGRDFTDRDDLQTPLVAVVNETFGKKAFPNDDPIGRHFTTPQTQGPVTIIGVVGDAKHFRATEPATPQIYVAHYQVPLIFSSLVARTSVAPMSITDQVRKAIWSVDKDQPVWSIYSLESAVERTQGQSRFLAILLGIFAGVALLLAAVGIYGVTSYGVVQRTHEIGIRIALGASADRVLGEVVRSGARLTLIAVAIGLVGAIAMGRLATAVLFGVRPTDPMALAAAAGVLAIVSVAATYLPARRASRVDPVVALAEE
jgi:putative ABC transport system permease protein